jgi:nicotinamide-nucleotide amidase
VNTHLRFLAESLFPLGLRIERQVAVPDGDAIREALVESFARADVVLVTGGLGPTSDDITREVTAELFGMELVLEQSVLLAITQRLAKRAIKPTDRTIRQAMRPSGAQVLQNEHGTAPGLYLPPQELPPGVGDPGYTQRTPHLFLLPGPPRELRPMTESAVIPILKKALPPRPDQAYRNYRVIGVPESSVEKHVGVRLLALGVELGYCAREGEVDIRVIGNEAQLTEAEEIIEKSFARQIASRDNRTLEQVVVELLAGRGTKIAVAESCTGGLLANRITNVPGASEVFQAGFVTYANEAKVQMLGVDAALLEKHGAVSRQVAAAMAEGAMERSGADFALSTTGIAGPGGGSIRKPVGTVYIGKASRNGATKVEKHAFPSDRESFKQLATQAALDLLRREMSTAGKGAARAR